MRSTKRSMSPAAFTFTTSAIVVAGWLTGFVSAFSGEAGNDRPIIEGSKVTIAFTITVPNSDLMIPDNISEWMTSFIASSRREIQAGCNGVVFIYWPSLAQYRRSNESFVVQDRTKAVMPIQLCQRRSCVAGIRIVVILRGNVPAATHGVPDVRC